MAKIVRFAGVLNTAEMLKAIAELEDYRVPQTTFNGWVHAGLVPASVRGPRGRRHEHWFSRDDLIRARLVARLRREGLSLQRVRLALAYLGDELADALATRRGRIVVDREQGEAKLIRHGRELEVLSRQYVLPLRDLHEGLDEAAARVAK